MQISSSNLAAAVASSPMNGAADSLVKRANQLASGSPEDRTKIHKAGQDFESLLLGQWLQQAEDSFGKLPGGDEDEGEDSGSSSMQGIAMQSLGQAMTASGGIGISRMITAQLEQKAAAETVVSQKRS
jgi:Rod binding domain-containing protein